jgi:hypothetical protein
MAMLRRSARSIERADDFENAAHRPLPTPVIPPRQHDAEDVPPPHDIVEAVRGVGPWRYAGRGHSPGEGVFASTIAVDLAESRRSAASSKYDDDPLEAVA